MLLEQFQKYLREKCLINQDDRILVGVSGGADSICLLDLLQKSGFSLFVAHFNHRLREEAESDAQFVQNVAQLRGVQFVKGEGDVRSYAKMHHKTIEEAARICRYEFLLKQSEEFDISTVAVAHTATDQAETILMHILRGCGLDGLKGMLPISHFDSHPEIKVIRPLLDFWKEEVLFYCSQNNLKYIEDATNNDPSYFRNKLRLQLVPILREYNPRFEKHLINLGEIAARDMIQLERLTIQEFEKCLIDTKADYVVLSKMRFMQVQTGLRQRVLQHCFNHLKHSSTELGFNMIERMVEFIQKPGIKKYFPVVSNFGLKVEDDFLYIYNLHGDLPLYNYPSIEPNSSIEINIPDEKKIQATWTIKTILLNEKIYDFVKFDGRLILETYLDAEKVKPPLLMKCQTAGDRFAPLGLEGKSQKLSDFWVNKKIPRRFRSTWPLLFCGDEIAWIPGFQPSHHFRVTDSTSKILKIKLIQNR
jgi:tRNA(Ile)-lysidine synthase